MTDTPRPGPIIVEVAELDTVRRWVARWAGRGLSRPMQVLVYKDGAGEGLPIGHADVPIQVSIAAVAQLVLEHEAGSLLPHFRTAFERAKEAAATAREVRPKDFSEPGMIVADALEAAARGILAAISRASEAGQPSLGIPFRDGLPPT